MEVDFKYAGYKCEYYAGNVHYKNTVCFSNGFGKSFNKHINCSYILYKEQNKLNKTFFNSRELLDVILILSKELGFTLMSINEDKTMFRVQIRMVKHPRWNLFVSTFIRYLFEFPASLATYCAYKNRDYYKNIKFTTLVQFFLDTAINIDSVHSISRNGTIIKDIHPKLLFNYNRDDFNFLGEKLTVACRDDFNFNRVYNRFDDCNLPKIVNEISEKVNSVYYKYEKSICSWH